MDVKPRRRYREFTPGGLSKSTKYRAKKRFKAYMEQQMLDARTEERPAAEIEVTATKSKTSADEMKVTGYEKMDVLVKPEKESDSSAEETDTSTDDGKLSMSEAETSVDENTAITDPCKKEYQLGPIKHEECHKKLNILQPIDTRNQSQKCDECAHKDDIIANLIAQITQQDVMLTKCTKSKEKWKRKCAELQGSSACFQETSDEDLETVDIGSGVRVPKLELASIKALSTKPTTFARRLMKLVFSIDELISSSISGKQSNANPNHAARPALDPKRLTAVIEYTLLDKPKAQHASLAWRIRQSLSTYLRELRVANLKATSKINAII